MEDIYRNMSLDKIPWNRPDPPQILIDAVESGKIGPCKTVDLGCGAGSHSIWLAKKDFEVTGIDISTEAIKIAKKQAEAAGVDCRFMVCDLLGDMSELNETFDFALDWELLHHIFPDDRPRYVKNVHNILKPGGTYFSLGFSENDPSFGGKGKFRETPIKTVLYFSSEGELRELFAPHFKILEMNTIEIPGKHGAHMAVASWLKRR
ncbi:MAG TPA: class I SAM-dependent methyltransferase [candidate division Zixibacteria bacterium]|nr:class I SAM-dependent methyltransferase [candidate division Zixibacteria bacterium]